MTNQVRVSCHVFLITVSCLLAHTIDLFSPQSTPFFGSLEKMEVRIKKNYILSVLIMLTSNRVPRVNSAAKIIQ